MGDYGGTSSASSSAAAAELHMKMSKKIAQLTKVIFHLNTRNEDFQSEFTHLKQVHAHEQQQLTQDAANKLKTLSEQVQSHKDADVRAARDKAQLLKDLAVFQQQAAAAQQNAQVEFQRRVAMLEDQVETSRRAFVDRIQQLTLMAETQQRAQQSQASATNTALLAAHRDEIDELKRKHSEEVEQVVMRSNAKFTQMLGEQLQLQDALKNELATQRALLENATHDQQRTQQQQAHWQREREDAQRRFDEMKQQLVGKMELLLADAETLRGHETRLRADKDELLTSQGELQRQLKMVELQVAKAQQETHSVRKDSDANAQKLQLTITASNETIAQLTRELDALKKTLASRDASLESATKERDALQLELLKGSASLSERHAQHTQQLSERDLKLANAQAELSLHRQQATASEALATKKIQALDARVAELTRELDELQKKLASAELLRASTHKEKEKTQSELHAKLEAADQTIVALRADHASALLHLQQSHAQALRALDESHKDATAALQRDADKRIAEVEAQLTQHSSASLAKALGEATQQHTEAMAQLRAAATAAEATWKQEKAQLDAQLQKLQAELMLKTKEAAEAHAKVVDLTAKLKKSEERLALVTTEKETLQKATQKTQKDRDEAFQKQLKELTAQHESVVKRLTSEKDRLVVEHKQTLMQVARDHADKLASAQAAWESDQRAQLTSQNEQLSAVYEQQLQELHAQRRDDCEREDEAARAAYEQRQQLEQIHASAVAALETELQQLTAHSAQRIVELETAHRTAMETMVVAHAQELDRLIAKHKHDASELHRNAMDQAEQKRTQLTTQHQRALETLRQQHAVALQSQHESLQTERTTEALALRTEMAQKLHELRLRKDSEHATRQSETAAVHAAQVAALDATNATLAASLAERSAQLDASQRQCETLQRALDAKTRELHERIATLERSTRDEIERLKLAAKRDMDRLLDENLAETKQLSEQFEETRQLLSEHVAGLQRAVGEWELKYARRESRTEDVARIAWLEQSCAEKDALVRQTLDEMAYFKRELLNREEMYNKTFARAPNVGVLQVLKPHVLLQAQLQSQTQTQTQMGSATTPLPMPPTSQQSARRASKPHHAQRPEDGLQRRGSERGTPGTSGAKKALPPLGNNNQAIGF